MKSLPLILTLGGLSITPANSQNTEKRNVGTYDGIHIAGSYEVTLVSGSEGTSLLKGDSDNIEKIDTDVKKGTLIIKQKEKSWFGSWDSGKVYINIPVEDINKVVLSGSGEIIADFPLEGDHFKTFLSGSGEINLNLDVTAVNGTVTGSGEITLTVKASKVNFNVTGSGDIEADGIKADTAEARVTGSGDIICKGNPRKQKTKVTGSGDIIVQN